MREVSVTLALPVSPREYWQLFVKEPEFKFRFHQLRGDYDIRVGEWRSAPNDHQQRVSTFTSPIAGTSFLPAGNASVKEIQLLHWSGDDLFLHCTLMVSGEPFDCRTEYQISKTSGGCLVRISSRHDHRALLFKDSIESHVAEIIQASFRQWLTLCADRLKDYHPRGREVEPVALDSSSRSLSNNYEVSLRGSVEVQARLSSLLNTLQSGRSTTPVRQAPAPPLERESRAGPSLCMSTDGSDLYPAHSAAAPRRYTGLAAPPLPPVAATPAHSHPPSPTRPVRGHSPSPNPTNAAASGKPLVRADDRGNVVRDTDQEEDIDGDEDESLSFYDAHSPSSSVSDASPRRMPARPARSRAAAEDDDEEDERSRTRTSQLLKELNFMRSQLASCLNRMNLLERETREPPPRSPRSGPGEADLNTFNQRLDELGNSLKRAELSRRDRDRVINSKIVELEARLQARWRLGVATGVAAAVLLVVWPIVSVKLWERIKANVNGGSLSWLWLMRWFPWGRK